MNENNQPVISAVSARLRPLKWDELVRPGDFVDDGRKGFEPWVGPSGFRADAFVKKIYRRQERRPAGGKAKP